MTKNLSDLIRFIQALIEDTELTDFLKNFFKIYKVNLDFKSLLIINKLLNAKNLKERGDRFQELADYLEAQKEV